MAPPGVVHATALLRSRRGKILMAMQGFRICAACVCWDTTKKFLSGRAPIFIKAPYGYYFGYEGGERKELRQKVTGSLLWWDTILGSLSRRHKPQLSCGPPQALSLTPSHGSFSGPKQCMSSVKHTPEELKGPDLALTIHVILTESLNLSEIFFFSNCNR